MKSKTSFYSSTLFWNTIKRFWPIFAAYLAIWIMALPLALNSSLKWGAIYNSQDVNLIAEELVLRSGATVAPIMAAVFGIFFAMAAFSYLYSSRSVSMICSLPVKREGVFLSVFTTGLAGMILSNILVFIISIIVESSYKIAGMNALWQWLAMACLNCLFFYGFAVFCASLTGHILILPCVYGILNFVVVVVEYFVRQTISGITYGMSANSAPTLVYLSPFYNLVFTNHLGEDYVLSTDGIYTTLGYYYENWISLIIYGAVGIVFALFALLLIKNRRMETAGDVVAVKPLKPIFKYCMSFGCALVLGVVINSIIFSNSLYSGYGSTDVLILILCMLAGAFIGYFAAEMLMRKTLRVFQRPNWVGYALTCIVVIALIMSCEFDLFGFEKNVPDASEVETVSLYGAFEAVNLSEVENIQSSIDLHKSIINNKKEYEKHTAGNSNDPDLRYGEYPITLRLSYTLKNGKTIDRVYNIYCGITDDCDVLSDIVNCEEAVQRRKSLKIEVSKDTVSYANISYYDKETRQYTGYTLSPEIATELFKTCIVPDIENKALGNIWINSNYSTVNGKSYYDEVYACNIDIELSKRDASGEYNNEYFNTTVTVSAVKTLEWLADHGIEPVLVRDTNYDDKGAVTAESTEYIS